MEIKSFPAWLKGGILIFLFLIIISLIFGTIFMIFSEGKCTSYLFDEGIIEEYIKTSIRWCYVLPFGLIFSAPSILISYFSYYIFGASIRIPYPLITSLTIWFTIGALIGLIINNHKKMKNKIFS